MKIILSVLLLALVSCANKLNSEFVKESKSQHARNIAEHVEDQDDIKNIGKGVKLELIKSINVKPNTLNFNLYSTSSKKVSLDFYTASEYDRELKSGAIFEIDKITEEWSYGTIWYTVHFKSNTKTSKIRINSEGYTNSVSVGGFKSLIESHFKVVMPAPIEMK